MRRSPGEVPPLLVIRACAAVEVDPKAVTPGPWLMMVLFPASAPLAKANVASEVCNLRFGGSCSIETKDSRIMEAHTAMNNEAGVGSRGAGIENGLPRKSLVRSGSVENLDASV